MLPTPFRLMFIYILACGSALANRAHLLPAGPMIADGTEAVTIHVWIPQLSDTDKVKLKPGHGKITSTKRFAGGIIAASWVPAREGAPRDVPVTATVKRRGQAPEVINVSAPLTAPRQGSIAVSASGDWEPGQEAVQLRFELNGTSDQSVGDRRLLLNASLGGITEAMPLGDGTFSARWTPPAEVPQARTVIITAVDASAPSSITGWTSFPLLVKQSLTFGATPDSQNVLIIGDRERGPVRASPAGTVAFDALVHPAIRTGTLRTTLPGGRSMDVPAPLPLAEYPRVSFFPQPDTIPSGSNHTILLSATTPGGEPLAKATITVQTEQATLGTAVATNVPGVYALTTQFNGDARNVSLTATMKDPAALINKLQRAESALRVIPGLPTATLAATPSPYPENAKQLAFNAKVEDWTGAPVRKSMPGISATPGRLLTRTANRGNGSYEMKIRPQGDATTAVALPRFEGSTLPAAGLVVWPAHAAVAPEGTVQVLAAVVDAFGHPVANQPIELTAPTGGTFPEKVKSNSTGIALTTYTANANPGLFTVNANANGFRAQTAIFHGDTEAGPGPVKSGDKSTMQRRAHLEPTVGTLRVNREINVPPPVIAAPVPQAPAIAPGPAEPAPPAPPAATPAPAPAGIASVNAAPPERIAAQLNAPKQSAQPATKQRAARKPKRRTASYRSSSRPAYDVTAALIGAYHGFTQTAEGDSDTVPPTASYSRTLAPGLTVNGNYWLDGGPWAASLDVRLLNDVVIVGDRIHGFTSWSLRAGGKMQLNSLALGDPYLSAGLERTQTTIFQSTSTTPLAPAVQGLVGARVGGGLVFEVSPGILVDASMSELFAPYPIATHLGAQASKEISGSLFAVAGLDVDVKHIGLSIDGTPIKVADNEIGLHIGLKYEGM